VKIHLKTNQGVANLAQTEAVKLSDEDPDSATRDLFSSITNKTFPSWAVYAQIINPQLAEYYTTNIFDATKAISRIDFPLITFGRLYSTRTLPNLLPRLNNPHSLQHQLYQAGV
jgi:catalase